MYSVEKITSFENHPKFCDDAPVNFLSKSEQLLKTLNPPKNYTFDGLSKEIWDLFHKIKQTPLEFTNKMNLWRDLNQHFKEVDSKSGLFVAGSTLNGFGLKSSDMDMSFLTTKKCIETIELLGKSFEYEQTTVERLESLLEHLKKFDNVGDAQVIKCKVPLISFIEKSNNIQVDLNFNATDNIRNTHLLYRYSQVDWRVKPLVTVIKTWGKFHKILDAKYGSLSSYPLILMVIHYLQCGVKPIVLPSLQKKCEGEFKADCDISKIDFLEEIDIPFTALYPCNKQSLGELLIGFLHYYDEFDFYERVISVREATTFARREHFENLKKPLVEGSYSGSVRMFIEEPFNMSNVAYTVYKECTFDKIKDVFHKSYMKLKETNELMSIFDKEL